LPVLFFFCCITVFYQRSKKTIPAKREGYYS
jgi:hypothetical protein